MSNRNENGIWNENPINYPGKTLTDSDRRYITQEQAGILNSNESPTALDAKINELFDSTKRSLHYFFSLNPTVDSYPYIPNEFGVQKYDLYVLNKICLTLKRRIQKSNGSPEIIDDFLLSDGAEPIINLIDSAYLHHIPHYTEMFEELDRRRVKNPELQEVYIGRDATFMYQARRAQFIARRESAKSLIYVNYPRNFISDTHMDTETRLQYLKDQGLTDIDNAVFIDTGFQGSIPRHIIRDVFGANNIDDKILLIYSINEPYLGDSGQRRHESVLEIEEAPQHEETAKALYNHKSGKIKATGEPTGDTVRFKYDLLRLLIMRHFYLEGLYTSGKLIS